MLNLFRMELRRNFHSKFLYITLSIFIIILVIALGTMALVTDPEILQRSVETTMITIPAPDAPTVTQARLSEETTTKRQQMPEETASKQQQMPEETASKRQQVPEGLALKLELDAEDIADAEAFTKSTQTDFLANLLFNGGLITVLIAILGAVIICDDFTTGFVKNIFPCQRKRSHYLISKLCLLTVISLFFIVTLSAATFVLFPVFRLSNPIGSPVRLLSMDLVGCAGLAALISQLLFFCMLTRHTVISILLSIMSGLGVIAGILDLCASQIGIHIAPYLPSYQVLMAPFITESTTTQNTSLLSLFASERILLPAPLHSVLISLIWTLIYLGLAAIVLRKRDIC